MNIIHFTTIAAVFAISLGSASPAYSAPVLHAHDNVGVLATVDVGTGDVNVIGNMGVVMTDIAFNPSGELFGIDFNQVYQINEQTANVSVVGPHGIPGGNALLFGEDGTLYGAGDSTTSLFSINPNTGSSTIIGNTGFSSAGDLAFNSGNLFMSSISNELIRINLENGATGTAIGPLGFPDVVGLATADDGLLYGLAGTEVLLVNPNTGSATSVLDFSGEGVGPAFGSSFMTEAGAPPPAPIPVPAALPLFMAALGSLGFISLRRS